MNALRSFGGLTEKERKSKLALYGIKAEHGSVMEGSPESNPGAGLFLGSPVLCVSTTLRNPATNKLGFTKSRYATLGASADSASMPLLKQQKRTMEQRSRQQRRLRPLSPAF